MHLCFIDESGTPPANSRGRTAYFVIAGVIIPETQWHEVASEFQAAKTKAKVRGEIKWRYFGVHNEDPKNSLKALDEKERNTFRDAIFNIVTKRNSIKIIACVASVRACYDASYIGNADELYQYCYKPVTERFQYFLQELSRESGSPICGMLIADHRDKKQDNTLKKHHQKLMFSSSPVISSYKNLIEGLFLTESHNSVGIQLADMVAGAIGRYFNSDDPTYFEKIKSSLRTNGAGSYEGFGLVKMPKKGWL